MPLLLVRIRIYPCGSGRPFLMRIRVDPDPKHCLKEAKACLEKTIGEDAIKIGVHLDSWILLAKLHFAMGNYSEALRYYEKAGAYILHRKSYPHPLLEMIFFPQCGNFSTFSVMYFPLQLAQIMGNNFWGSLIGYMFHCILGYVGLG